MRTNSLETTSTPVHIAAPGGPIRGHMVQPAGQESVIAAVVLHPATAVPERLYTGFAQFLAAQGYGVITYDYRGTGTSGTPREHRKIRMRDWMSVDVPTVARWAKDRFPEAPQFAVGHSIGGHALSLDHGSSEVEAFVTIASHAGVTATIQDAAERRRVGLVLRVLGPLTARMLGYVPGKRLGLGEDMPGAAMVEWSGWSRLPGYFFDDPTMDAAARAGRVNRRVLAIGFSDDAWATPAQIDAITDRLVNAHVERRTVSPAESGATTIGHMGFFRSAHRDTLWPLVSEWLRAQLKPSA